MQIGNPFRITNETIVSASKIESVSDLRKLDVCEVGRPLRVDWNGLWHEALQMWHARIEHLEYNEFKFRSVAMLPGTATGHNGCWVGTKGGRIDRRFFTWYTPVKSFSNGNYERFWLRFVATKNE